MCFFLNKLLLLFSDKESKEEEDTTAVQKGFVNAKQSRIEKIREKKRKLKEMFESEFEDKSDYFDSWKADMKQQAQVCLCY